MTFHVGNGITLTKEEENLPPEERERIIEAKRRVNEEADRKLEESLGGAREYFKYESNEPIDPAKRQAALDYVEKNYSAQSAVDLVNRLDREDKAEMDASTSSTSSGSSGGSSSGIVQSTGTYGTLRNEDFTAYREQRDAERRRQREAIAAGNAAANAKRDEFLATGMYFDDGRGNIKLKKEYRKQGVNNVPHRRGHFNKDTEHNTYAGMTNQMIQAAGQAAYRNSMEAAVAANREGMAQAQEAKARRAADNAEGEVAVFDSLVAALDDMRTGDRIEEEVIGGSRGIEMSDASGQRWTYDSNGNRVPVTEGKKTGLSIRSGYLSPTRIKALNGELERLGSNRRVSGIVVRQKFDPKFPDKKIGEPMFYVQGDRFNPETKKSSPYGQWMTMKDVYRMGLVNAKTAGGMFASTHSEESIREMLDDVYGTGTRAREAAKAATAIQVGELAIKEEKNRLERDKFEYEQRKNIFDAVMEFEKTNGRPASDLEFVRMLPESIQKNLVEPVAVLGDDGAVVMDDMGEPMMRPPNANEVGARIRSYKELLQREDNARKTPFEQIVGLLNPAAAKIGDSTATPAKQPTKEELLAERARRQQAGGAGATALAATPTDTAPVTTPAPTPAPALTEKAKGLADKMAKSKDSTATSTPTSTATPAPEKPSNKSAYDRSREQNRIRARARAELTSRYRTVQDVTRDVVKTLNNNGALNTIVNPDGTRRTDLTPQEKDAIIYNVHKKFIDAGMSDFWDREVEEYTPQNYGGRLTKDAIIDKLFRDWNNKTAPFAYGYKRINQE